ncbi:MAG TPA: M20/M25/M40 family metallo-hydrolase [Patescibacteria group bacterium]|nr:M20/M25/M40 family metallo-hydrolase [Patescibacteria group bacterium]
MKNNTLTILKDLIKIPSFVDGENNDAELAQYIKNFFKKMGDRYYVEEQKVEGNRINLIIKNCKDPKIFLFGHLDTVLPKKETIKPFEPRIEGNKLFGLGAVDMKSGLAIMLNQASKNTKPGLGFIFTADEEYEFKGAFKLIEKYKFKPKLVINVEPTNAQICNGCRGITEFSFIVNGKSVHAGRKQLGINAIEKTIELTNKLQESISRFDNKTIGKSSLNLAYLHGGVLQEIDKNGIKKISGKGMIVPNYAEVNCEIRLASEKISKTFITNEIVRLAKSLGVTVEEITFKFYLGSMLTPKINLKSFEKAFLSASAPMKYRDLSTSGFYEVQLLQEKWGTDCIVFGPGPIELSHTANEYVDIESIKVAEKVIESYITSTL